MENEKLAQAVKDLRKKKGLSQEELAKHSGLSLRTIQRVENGETEPAGETLRRISTALDVAPNELIDCAADIEILKKTVKGKYEYLHIFESKLVFSTTPEIKDLVADYGKSVNNMFKSLMVFLIFIPIFTILTVIFYNMGKMGSSIHSAGMGLIFLTIAFYSILFTSGSSLIKMDGIKKIKMQRTVFGRAVVILYKESGRLKKRALVLEKSQVDNMKSILLSEKLIEKKDINLKGHTIYMLAFAVVFIIIPNFLNYQYNIIKGDELTMYYGLIMILVSALMIVTMVIGLMKPRFNKNKKSLTLYHK